jgi:hypothetical protein
MANGSFGLSGFPTAPTTTSTGGGTNNALTPVTVAVNSVAGFSSGTLVYNRNGDYANPVTSTGTSTFPITVAAPVFNSVSAPTWTSTPSTASGDCCVINNTGVSTGFSYGATLTNGNIVIAYKIPSSGATAFKILDENYAVVVAETTVASLGATGQNNVGLIALTGGGFVIYTLNASAQPQFAIYSNTGTVVTAATTDTTYGFGTGFLQLVPRPDGSWIMYGVEGAGNAFVYKVFSATGAQVYAWTSIGTTNTGGSQVTIAVRSDNSFVLAWYIVTTNLITYAVRSATNTVTVAPTSTGVTGTTNRPIASVCLSTNDVVFVYQALTNSAFTARTLSSANVLGSVVTLFAYDSTTYFGSPTHFDVYLLPSDNYLVSAAGSISNGRYYANTMYFVASSAGVILSGTNPLVLTNTNTNTNSLNWCVFVRTTNYIHHINAMPFQLSINSNTSSLPCVIIASRISPTTFAVVPNQSTTQTIGSTTAQPVSAYAPGNSSAIAAAFYATASATISTTVASTTGTNTGTTIESFVVNQMDSCPLSGGGVAILYYQTSTGTVKVAIYNAAMVLQTTISFTTGWTTTLTPAYKVIQLSNGKLVVSYQTASNTFAFKVYSTSYALLTTFSATGTSYNLGGLTQPIGMAPLSGARFVVAVLSSSTPYYAVYTDTGANPAGPTQVDGLNGENVMVASTSIGFIVAYTYTGTSQQWYAEYYEAVDQSNTWTIGGLYNTSTGGTFFDGKAVSAVNGVPIIPTATGTTSAAAPMVGNIRAQINGSLRNQATVYSGTINFSSPTGFFMAGAPCVGGRVLAIIDSPNRTLAFNYQAGAASANGMGFTTLTFTDTTTSTSYAGFRLVGLYGTYMVFSYINASQYPAYAIINIDSRTYDTALVAGTTPSNPSQTLAPSTGYYLLGVAASDCPANGSGNVTINGSATLNSTYPATATAQSFDFSSPVTFGAKGTQLNRNVNLQGNV